MNEFIQTLLGPKTHVPVEPTTLSETNERLLELRMTEMETREEIIDYLKQVFERKLWRRAGFKTIQEFCEKELSYSPNETREILIRIGAILTPLTMIGTDPEIQGRIDRLRAWRKTESSAAGLPAYRILTNRTLMAIAEANPLNLDSLAKVKGMGDYKLEKFGPEILERIKIKGR